MKQMIAVFIVTFFVFLAVSMIFPGLLTAQDWGAPGRVPGSLIWLAGHIEVGLNPYISTWDWADKYPIDRIDNLDSENAFYTDFGLTVHLSHYVFCGGYAKSWTIPNEDDSDSVIPNFIPFLIDYGFFFGLRYKNLEIGLRHFCSHPVIIDSSFAKPMMENNRSYEEIYVRFEF